MYEDKWWKDPLMYIVLGLVILWAYSYWNYTYAGNVTLTWTPPTEQIFNCQSQPIEGLAGFKIYELVADITDPAATTITINERPPGDQTYISTAYNDSGQESFASNSATKTVAAMTTISTTAYVLGTIENAVVFFVAGTVPLGTACFDNQFANGKHAFDLAEFTPTDPATKPLVVFANCQ
jgi:hypothetical protein